MAPDVLPAPRWPHPGETPRPEDADTRVECIGGTLILSAPFRLAHQLALVELLLRLGHYCATIGGWFVSTAPFDLLLDPYTIAPPDLAVFRLRDQTRYPASIAEAGRPVLLVEVLTPGSAEGDRTIKRARYQRMGADTLLVDLAQRTVERWTPEAVSPEVTREVVTWRAPGATTAFTLDLPRFFDRTLGC